MEVELSSRETNTVFILPSSSIFLRMVFLGRFLLYCFSTITFMAACLLKMVDVLVVPLVMNAADVDLS